MNKMRFLFIIFLGALFFWANAQSLQIPWYLTGNSGTTTSDFIGTTDCNPLIFKTGDVERMRLLNNQACLGIGISKPLAPLHVHDQTDTSGCIGFATYNPLGKKLLQLTTPETGTGDKKGFSIFCNNLNGFTFKQYEQANFAIEGPGGGLVIAPNGNIGIGISIPTATLDVNGSFKAQNATIAGTLSVGILSTPELNIDVITTNVLSAQKATLPNITGNTTVSKTLTAKTLTAQNANISMDAIVNGYLGIGTDDPKEKLHVKNGNILISKTTSSDIDGSIIFNDCTGGVACMKPYAWGIRSLFPSEGDGLEFWRSGAATVPDIDGGEEDTKGITSVLFLANNNNVGIGTKTPRATLDVNGGIKAKSANITGDTYFSGNVGIGTTIPKQKLHIVDGNILISNTSAKAPGSINGSILFGADVTDINPMGNWGIEYLNSDDPQYGGYGLNFWKTGNWNYALFLADNGNVGIGKKDPQSKLDVNGGIKAQSANIAGVLSAKILNMEKLNADTITTKVVNTKMIDVSGWVNASGAMIGGTMINIGGYGGSKPTIMTNILYAQWAQLDMIDAAACNINVSQNYPKPIMISSGGTEIFSVWDDGTMFAQKAFIKGKIITKEIQVTLSGWSAWPDHVFAKDYKLLPLGEVAQYIKENNRLPDIPSATEVEENGIELGSMQAKLLQKIEELTLYAIEQQKLIEDLQKQVKELQQTKGGQ